MGRLGSGRQLFRNDSNYRETRLLRDSSRPAIYLTLDFWNSREAYEQFMASHKNEYRVLDAMEEELTSFEQRLGWYEQVE